MQNMVPITFSLIVKIYSLTGTNAWQMFPKTKNIFTMGMRGIHDGRMQGVKTIEGEAKILQEVINAQRELLKNSGSIYSL